MVSRTESICCQEDLRTQDKIDQYPDVRCITEVPGLTDAILSEITLEIAYLQFRQEHRERRWQVDGFNQPGNRYVLLTKYSQYILA